jgi:hypothetical protein
MLFLPVISRLDLWHNSSAKVAELADAPDLGSGTERCGGSSPPFRTTTQSYCRHLLELGSVSFFSFHI